ncbi:MAG TPA: alpha-amylase family glycosyl hydrolase [Mycobacteriales bacterium]
MAPSGGFADSDGDGVGDLPGALAHLDHLAWLGVDAVWFNPCFASPFKDAGYDVSDYLRIAPRYGTNEDMVAFVDACRERGIRVVLDLVAGHTSVEHEWFPVLGRDAGRRPLHLVGPARAQLRALLWPAPGLLPA